MVPPVRCSEPSSGIKIARSLKLQSSRIKEQASLPFAVPIVELGDVLLRFVLPPVVRFTDTDMLRSRRAMRIVHSSNCTAVFPLRLIVADLEIQPRIHTVCDTHILLDDVIDIRARLRMEACLFIVRIGKLVPAAELIIVVVETELIVAERYAAAALSIVAEARMHLIRAFLFRNDIDDAGDCLAAVKDRTAAFDDLNALDLARRNLIEIVLAAPCDRIAVHEYECTSLEAAHIDFVRHCTHRCSVRAKGFINKAIHLLKCIRCIRRTALLNILGRDDRRRCRHIDIPLLCTRRRHNDFAERICRQCLVITCPRMCGLRRIDLSRHRRKHDSSRKELLIPHLHRHYHSPLLKIIISKINSIENGRSLSKRLSARYLPD